MDGNDDYAITANIQRRIKVVYGLHNSFILIDNL